MTKRIAIYARTNSNESGTKSIEAQVDECTTKAKLLYGEDIETTVYKDEAVSKYTMRKPSLLSLQQGIFHNNLIDAVIVSNLNSIGGSSVRSLNAISSFLEHHVDFVSVQEKLDLICHDNHAVLKLETLKFEAEARSRRMKTAWARRKARQQTENK